MSPSGAVRLADVFLIVSAQQQSFVANQDCRLMDL